MNDKIAALQTMIDNSSRIVFFGGAGVSTESGIPDFRSVDGLYSQHYSVPPETMLSHSYFVRHPEEFFRFHREKMLCPDAEPNDAHKKLAELEAAGKLTAVITQNIDGLHQKAGSKRVLELHGSVWRNYCMRCGRRYGLDYVLEHENVPTCEHCGGIVRPDVVLYEESLDGDVISASVAHLREADLVIVGGTSLVVYPAAGLLQYTRAPIVLINRSPTGMDARAALLLTDPIGEVLRQIVVTKGATST